MCCLLCWLVIDQYRPELAADLKGMMAALNEVWEQARVSWC